MLVRPIRVLRMGFIPAIAAVFALVSLAEVTKVQGGAVGRPVRGGTLRMLSEAPMSLDPLEADSVYESLPVSHIFNGLVSMDASLNVLPSLASTWTVSRDGRVYTFKLRPGVRFHDGSALTSEDVVFTIRRLLAPKNRQANIACSYMRILEGAAEYGAGARADLPGIAAIDALTVRFNLTQPYYSFLQVLAMDGLKIVSREQVARLGEAVLGRAPVGTGPFRLSAWSSDRLALAANPGYFGDKPFLHGVDIRFFEPDELDSGASRFEQGSIDAFEVPPLEESRFLDKPGIRIRRYQELSLTFLGIHTATPPMNKERLRQAIAHAFDARRLVEVSPRFRRAAMGILPPGLQGYSPQNKTLTLDLDASRRLLSEAGHPGGAGLRPIELFYNSDSSTRKTAERIQAELGGVGIPIEIRAVSWSELSTRIDTGRAPLFLLTWVADLPDPDSFLRTLFESDGASNFFGFRDSQVHELVASGFLEMNPVVRAGIYRRIEQRVLDLAPLVPLYHPVGNLAVRTNVHGLEPGPLGLYAVDLTKVWIARQTAAVRP